MNAAQLVRPWGATLTFQLYTGVPWVHGLRHGVTMHPRGRHLREGMIPWSHGKSRTKAREQQPPHQLLPSTQPQELHGGKRAVTQRGYIKVECRAVSPHQPEENVEEVWSAAQMVWPKTARPDGNVLDEEACQHKWCIKEHVPTERCWTITDEK